MHKTRSLFIAWVGGVLLLAGHLPDAVADEADGGFNPHLDAGPWSQWQGRVSLASSAPAWRSGLGALGGAGNAGDAARRPGRLDSFSLLGDYYFARPFASTGGLRATSGLFVGPRSRLLSISQPGLTAGGLFSVDSRSLAQPNSLRSRDAAATDSTATIPYVGFGYTGRSAGGALSLSADVGMVGQMLGETQGRASGASLRSLDEPGRDSVRLLPMLQLGVLYSF